VSKELVVGAAKGTTIVACWDFSLYRANSCKYCLVFGILCRDCKGPLTLVNRKEIITSVLFPTGMMIW